MAHRRRVVSFSLTLLLSAVCAASVCAAKPKQAAADEELEGHYVEFAPAGARGEVRADKALVYIVRPAFVGYAIKSWFVCDDTLLGINKGQSYFFAHVDPGQHVFWSKSENVDALELEVEAGKTYYIQQRVRMGGLKARTKLEVLDETAGSEALAKCKKHATMTERGRIRGAEIAREYRARTGEDLERRARDATAAATKPED